MVTHARAASALRDSGRSQRELAHALGWPESTISQILKGRRPPTLTQAVALERELGIAPADWVPAPAPDTEPDHPVPGAA